MTNLKVKNSCKMNHKLRLFNLAGFFFFFLISQGQTSYEDYLTYENIFTDNFSNDNSGWPTGLSANGCYSSTIENEAFEITSNCSEAYTSYRISRSIDVNSISGSDLQGIILRPYIGISAGYMLLAGNFDGKSVFTLPTDEIILVPKLSPAPGFGVQFGIRSNHTEFDWAYNISRMKYTSLTDGFSGTSTNHFIRLLGVKGFIGSIVKKKVKPYIYFDWSLATSHFEKLAYNPSAPLDFKSANYIGMIVGLGAGIQLNLNKHLALDLRLLPEYYFGTDIKSKGERDYPIKKFNNFLLINSFGINYYFNKR
jgi:hypothetical protein